MKENFLLEYFESLQSKVCRMGIITLFIWKKRTNGPYLSHVYGFRAELVGLPSRGTFKA